MRGNRRNEWKKKKKDGQQKKQKHSKDSKCNRVKPFGQATPGEKEQENCQTEQILVISILFPSYQNFLMEMQE